MSVGGRRIRVIKSLAASFHILEGTRFSVVHASAIPTCLTFEDDLVLKLYRHEIQLVHWSPKVFVLRANGVQQEVVRCGTSFWHGYTVIPWKCPACLKNNGDFDYVKDVGRSIKSLPSSSQRPSSCIEL